MTSVAAPFHPTHTTGSWEDFEKRVGGAAPALALYALGVLPLVWLDTQLRESSFSTMLLLPSAGMLFIVLWLSRPSRWPALVVAHVLVTLGLTAAGNGLPQTRRVTSCSSSLRCPCAASSARSPPCC